MSNTVVINGVSVTVDGGQSLTVCNGRVIIDGKDVTPEAKEINIFITGDVKRIEADACSKISVTGDVSSISTQSGGVNVVGNINGSVQTMSGDVYCEGAISGNVRTMSGDIRSCA